MYKRGGKIAKFHGISRKTAVFTENRPFLGPRHCRKIAKSVGPYLYRTVNP